jgi:penicillin-binding protein 2
VIIDDASLAQVAAITARRLDFELPDVVVEEVPTRRYPTDAMAAHLFGYVGEASEAQMGDGITNGSIVGQSGVERVYNKLLMGEDGAKRVVVNSVGREIRTLEEIPPKEGKRIQLTIDYDLQKAAEDGFRAGGFNGAALIMDPKTGEILTEVSLPAYDPPRGRRSIPISSVLCRIVRSRDGTRPDRPSRSWLPPPRSRKGSSPLTSR